MSRIGNLSSRIFVGGLDPAVDESDLEKAFALFGEITNVMVMRDRENGRSRGFAFISFKDSLSSEEAISRMHGVEIRGRCVTVRHAERERFIDDKNQDRGSGFVRGRGGHVGVSRPAISEYGSRNFQISKTVYVTEDDQDYTRSRYDRKPSPRSRSPNFSSDVGRREYRDRSPHHRDDRYRQQSGQYSSYEKTRAVTAGRLSPTEELSAYVESRYRDYSPLRSLTKQRNAESDGYRNSGRSQRERSSPQQDYSDRRRQYMDDGRQSPTDTRMQRSGGVGSRFSTSSNNGGLRRYEDDNRVARDYGGDSRRPVADSRGRPQRDGNFTRDPFSRDVSGDRNARQRSPRRSSFGDWNRGASRNDRDRREERMNDVERRDHNANSSRYGGRGVRTYGARDSQEDWKSRENDTYQGRNRADRWRNQKEETYQDRSESSAQSWKRGSTNTSINTGRSFQRDDGRSGGTEYRKGHYQSDYKDHSRGTESYRGGSPVRRQSGPGNGRASGARRY